MPSLSRVLLAAGALLASVTLAKAENHTTFSPDLKDPQPKAEAAPLAAEAPPSAATASASSPDRRKATGRRTRVARSAKHPDDKAVATAPAATRSAAAEAKAAEARASYEPATAKPEAAEAKAARPEGAANTEAAAPTPGAAPAAGGAIEKPSGTVAELLARHAQANGVPLKLAQAVVRIESRGNVRASNHGALGLMQIKYGTARAAGFGGAAVGLLVADTNLRYGMKILGQAYKAAGGDTCGALMRYQSGHLSTHMNAANRAYCSRARALMAGA